MAGKKTKAASASSKTKNASKRQARAEARVEERPKTLAERRANAPKGTSIDAGFAHGDGPAGPFGGAAKAERA